jgi:hypothetical protein
LCSFSWIGKDNVNNAGEVLWKLCDDVQAADGHTWQRVLGETDVLPGWVAVEYLQLVEPPE